MGLIDSSGCFSVCFTLRLLIFLNTYDRPSFKSNCLRFCHKLFGKDELLHYFLVMAGNMRFEVSSGTPEEAGFSGSYPNGQRGNYQNASLDRSGSFREGGVPCI